LEKILFFKGKCTVIVVYFYVAVFLGSLVGSKLDGSLKSCKADFANCRKLGVNASYVAENCVTKLGALNETLRYLKAALDQLDKVDTALGNLINNSGNNATTTVAAVRKQRQIVEITTVTTVQVITVVTQYQSIIVTNGKLLPNRKHKLTTCCQTKLTGSWQDHTMYYLPVSAL
jgi:hypothetical protein